MHITDQTIEAFIKELPAHRKAAILTLIEIMKKITKREPKLWGNVIGFGKLYYRYATGHDGYMPIIGLANRKQAITLYLSYELEKFPELKELGKHKIGKSCLYIQNLAEINQTVLVNLINKAYNQALAYSFVQLIE
jgi:hypothetical protein